MDPALLEILACPVCRSALRCEPAETDGQGMILSGTLRCDRCRHDYPIEDGIPDLRPPRGAPRG